WINQPEAKGVGHAVLQARSFTNKEPFIVHAGDTYITSNGEEHIRQILKTQEKEEATATLCLLEVDNPKHYGIAEIIEANQPYRIKRVIEKPEKPLTNLAVMPIYAFTERIYEALEETKPGKGGETQLTDGIQKLIEWNQNVLALILKHTLHLDIGTPGSYWHAQKLSYQHLASGQKRHLLTRIIPEIKPHRKQGAPRHNI
ncbi:MAG: sugar phosphate nucleotidyltransferase, partial [Nitrososphaerales archaeon]